MLTICTLGIAHCEEVCWWSPAFKDFWLCPNMKPSISREGLQPQTASQVWCELNSAAARSAAHIVGPPAPLAGNVHLAWFWALRSTGHLFLHLAWVVVVVRPPLVLCSCTSARFACKGLKQLGWVLPPPNTWPSRVETWR